MKGAAWSLEFVTGLAESHVEGSQGERKEKWFDEEKEKRVGVKVCERM